MTPAHEPFEPTDGDRAFTEPSGSGRSRAVHLLLLAEQLSRGEHERLPIALHADAAELDAPTLEWSSALGEERRARAIFGVDAKRREPAHIAATWSAVRRGDGGAALELLGMCTHDPSPFARLGAIVGLLALSRAAGLRSRADDHLLRCLFAEQYRAPYEVGAVARELFDLLTSPEERELPPPPGSRRPGSPAGGSLSIGVHGTFSRYGTSRVAPNQPFYSYLSSQFSPELFQDERTCFRWSGRYARADRSKAARDLPLWLDSIGDAEELDTVYAHSHGGNVALSALAQGLRIKFLVLLSVPPIERSSEEWATIDRHVGYAMSLRSRLDWVVLADLVARRAARAIGVPGVERSSGLDFPPEADIHTTAPFGWFSHSTWLDQHVWQTSTIEAEVRNKHALAHAASS